MRIVDTLSLGLVLFWLAIVAIIFAELVMNIIDLIKLENITFCG